VWKSKPRKNKMAFVAAKSGREKQEYKTTKTMRSRGRQDKKTRVRIDEHD
jgi:hypothetical protein